MGRRKMIDIGPPIGGISDDMGFMDQLPGTTRQALNARGLDPVTGRRRIAKRSGLTKYLTDQVNGSNKIKDLVSIIKNEDNLTYSAITDPTNVFAKVLPGQGGAAAATNTGDCVDMRMDEFGDLYVAQRTNGVFKYNPDGHLLAELLIPEVSAGGGVLHIAAIDVDEFGNVAVAVGGPGTTSASISRLHFFVSQLDGTYALGWSLDSTHCFSEVGFHDGDIYTLETTDIPGGTLDSYLKVYRDYELYTAPTEDTTAQAQLDGSTVVNVNNSFGTRMAIRDDGVVYVVGCDSSTSATAVSTFLTKLDPNGETPGTALWTLKSGDDISGLGYGVALGPKTDKNEYTVYTYGPQGSASTDAGEARKIVDLGASASTSATGAWVRNGMTVPLANPHNTKFNRIDTDYDGHLYIAPPATSGNDVEILNQSDGTALNSFTEALADSTNGGTCVAVSKEEKPKGSSVPETEFVYFGTRAAAGGFEGFFKQRMLTVAQGSSSMRSIVRLAVAGGNIEKFTTSGATAPTGGAGAIATDALHVMSTTLGEYAYFTDGTSYQRYSVVDDKVEPLISSTSSAIPPRCRIMTSWRGRLVLARDPEDPQVWHMSAVGDPTNWDNYPTFATATQAISGINAKAGKVPDIVNSIIPWDDDLCLFGGDRSIWRLTGDPMAGGQFDLVSDETGIAFGNCWAKDPIGGRLFFFGSRGGVYMMQRNSLPVRISRDRIERRLQDVNLATTYIRMVWNYRDEGLHVFQLPFGSGGTILKHWFWDAKHEAWWEDQFGSTGSTDAQPTAVHLFDGDAQGDRVLMFGCEDGRIRKWDETAKSDQGASSDLPIAFEVVYGPLVPANEGREYTFTGLTAVLADDQGGAGYRVYAQDQADKLGLPVARGSFHPGRNNSESVRFRGPNAWLSVSNTLAGQRCAIEDVQVHVSQRGRVRRR